MNYRIAVLLDRPSPRSFGMVPFVAEKPEGGLLICGLEGRANENVDHADLDRLVAERHALAVEEDVELPTGVPLQDWVAGWYGDEFAKRVIEIEAPQAQLPPTRRISGQGRFWVNYPEQVYAVLDGWIREAAIRCLQSNNAALADLMGWVLPDRVETRAAIYRTRASEQEKERALAWWARLARDKGGPVSVEDLRDTLNKAVGEILQAAYATAGSAAATPSRYRY